MMGAAGAPRYGRRRDPPPSLMRECDGPMRAVQVQVVCSNVNARPCVYACVARLYACCLKLYAPNPPNQRVCVEDLAKSAPRVTTTRRTQKCRVKSRPPSSVRRPETKRQAGRAPPLVRGPPHALVRRQRSSLHTLTPSSSIQLSPPPGVYVRLVTPVRAPLAAPIAPSRPESPVQDPSPVTKGGMGGRHAATTQGF